jgi:hypothetical protein
MYVLHCEVVSIREGGLQLSATSLVVYTGLFHFLQQGVFQHNVPGMINVVAADCLVDKTCLG